MSYMNINSPYSGDPVKIRTTDIGRAVKDTEGRIFYVLPRSDGKGYYSSITRKGGPREEQQFLAMEAKTSRSLDVGQERSQQQIAQRKGGESSAGRALRKLINLIITLAILAGLGYAAYWAFTAGPLKDVLG